MRTTLSIDNNKYKTFVLSLSDSKEISFEEKDLFSFVKYKNEELKIFNKDKEFIFSKFNIELKGALEKYISSKSKKDRFTKLNKIIIDSGLSENIKISEKKMTILHLNSGNELNQLFSKLLKNKTKHSTLFKMLFSDKNLMINRFISKDKKEIFHSIEKIANNINKNDSFFTLKNKKQSKIYNKKMSVMLEVPSKTSDIINKKIDFIDKSRGNSTQDNMIISIKKREGRVSEIANEANEKLKIISEISKNEVKMNNILGVFNGGVLKTIECINNLSVFTGSKPEDISADLNFIKDNNYYIDKLKNVRNKTNNIDNYLNLGMEELNSKLNEIELTITILDEEIKKILSFKECKLNVICDFFKLHKFTTINDFNSKSTFLDKIKDISSQLYFYNESLKKPKGIFSRIYKYFFPNKYQKKQKESNNAFHKVNELYKNLFHLLNSEDFKNNPVPEWACKMVAKTINESVPMNDIFWCYSKEHTEWNKIYKEFFLEK
ncbi:hypothetical protein [Proteus hauseri]|uniref:hypothetical protein n=1 Tax=Proteus hauseri TaxID=183417 RepID=UPI0010097D9F|nr:hypothetical protein [Proteus hauseri]QAV22495.1 hypothetical protein PH4a_03705 [Proteus hauseri]